MTLAPEKYQWMPGINPMAGIIDGFRSALPGKPWNMPTMLTSMTGTVVPPGIGAWYYRQTERRFADIA